MQAKGPTLKQIQTFLEEAKRHGYDAEVKNKKSKLRPGTDRIQYPRTGSPQNHLWFWEDIWVGESPFSGTTTLWHRGKPCWQNHYWGYVRRGENTEFVYSFLRWARRETWKQKRTSPVRGAGKFKGLIYEQKRVALVNAYNSFCKYEHIRKGGKTICEVFEMKGLVG